MRTSLFKNITNAFTWKVERFNKASSIEVENIKKEWIYEFKKWLFKALEWKDNYWFQLKDIRNIQSPKEIKKLIQSNASWKYRWIIIHDVSKLYIDYSNKVADTKNKKLTEEAILHSSYERKVLPKSQSNKIASIKFHWILTSFQDWNISRLKKVLDRHNRNDVLIEFHIWQWFWKQVYHIPLRKIPFDDWNEISPSLVSQINQLCFSH